MSLQKYAFKKKIMLIFHLVHLFTMQHNKQELCTCTVHAEIYKWMYINIPLNT